MTNPYRTINDIFILVLSELIKLSYTGLLGYLPVCTKHKHTAVIIRERQGYYCMEHFQLV